MDITVIGCGRWGSLITWYLDHIGHRVTLYGRATSHRMQSFLATRQNDLLTLPPSVALSTDLPAALDGAETVIISIGSQGLRKLLTQPELQTLRDRTVVLCMKGLEMGTGERLSVIAGELLHPSCTVAVWLGPGHVQEFYRGIPNCMVIDSENEQVKRRLVQAFSSDLIRFYYGGDMIEESMWTTPTAEQLARYVWTWQGDLAEQPAMATMSLTQGSGAEPGQITFTWWYTKDYGDPQEIYEGSWSLTDSGEHIDLTMTRSGGRQYTKGEAPTTVSGMFPVQVPAAFDVFPVLNVTGGGGAYGFPIQQIPNELLMFEPAQG